MANSESRKGPVRFRVIGHDELVRMGGDQIVVTFKKQYHSSSEPNQTFTFTVPYAQALEEYPMGKVFRLVTEFGEIG